MHAQHSTLAVLKEMLLTLDLAVDCGNTADRAAADRLQRKCAPPPAVAAPLSSLRRDASQGSGRSLQDVFQASARIVALKCLLYN